MKIYTSRLVNGEDPSTGLWLPGPVIVARSKEHAQEIADRVMIIVDGEYEEPA